MRVVQARLPEGIMREMNQLVKKGFYTNKSDVIRDALRKLILEKQVGSVPNSGNSVKEVRAARKKLSREELSPGEVNALGE
ncbi:MAG TPA: transcriptional regulator [Candidatus Woesearchaeota archaeon]|nr:transcriptional regulator [Candidatus Woesearchaeota archaeon]